MEHPALKPLRELRTRIVERFGEDLSFLGFIEDAEITIVRREREILSATAELINASAAAVKHIQEGNPH